MCCCRMVPEPQPLSGTDRSLRALIIHPKGKDPIEYDREYVILLSDWTDEDPEVRFANLEQESTSPVSTLRWLP